MRRPLAFFALSVVWAGCFSSGSSGGPQTTFDAGFDAAEFDTSVEDSPGVEAAAEASPEASTPVDAVAPADATIDTYDAGVPVIVVVQGASGPESGVTVVYADASGNPLGTQTTDASGRASRVVGAGSVLTVLLGDPSVYASPTTIMGVQPGDVLTLVDWRSLQATPFDVTAQAPLTGAVSYLASVAQAADQSPLPVSVTPNGGQSNLQTFELGLQGLVMPPSFPVLLDARDANDNPLGYLYSKASPFPAMPDSATAGTITLGGSWSTSYTTQTVSVTNLPDGGEPFGGFQTLMNEAVAGTLTQTPSSGSNVFTTHAGFPDFEQIEVSSSEYFTGAVAMATAIATPTADGAPTVDLTPLGAVPAITSLSIDNTVPTQPVFNWVTSFGSLSAMTGVVAFASWSTVPGDAGAANGTWTIVSPGTSQTSLQAPPLPAAQSAWAPAAGASFNSGNLWAVTGSALPTYAAVRAATSVFPDPPECETYGPFVPALPAVGTSLAITMSSVTNQCD